MLELKNQNAAPSVSKGSPVRPRRSLQRDLGSIAALLVVVTSLAAACSSESASRADDGGAGGSAGSAGRGGGGGANPCTECITDECAAETGRCVANAACQSLASCYDACTDEDCATECDQTYPAGVTDWYALVTCSAQSCADPCEIEGSAGTGGIGATCVPPTENGECDNFPRVCGCTATQNCIFSVETNDTACAAIGTTPPHARCTSETCTKFHGCVGGNESGTCRPYCEDDDDCGSTPFNRCIQVTDGDDQDIEGFKVCTQHCNLSDPRNTAGNPSFGACGAGANCVLGNSTEGTAICFGTSPPPLPATCEDHGDCAAGYGCSVAGACQKWCRVGSNADCASTAATPVCSGFTTRLFMLSGADGGKSEYGFCVARADGGTGPAPDGGPSIPPPP
jgi:hypothetical protein